MSVDDAVVAYPLFQKGNGGSIPTSAHQLWIEEIDWKKAIELNQLWHSRLPEYRVGCRPIQHCRYCFGAIHKNTIYAISIWSHPNNRFLDNKDTLELRRMAISPNAPKNTASFMISKMVKIINKNEGYTRFISYQDTEVHRGIIYKASGWNSVSENSAMDYSFGGSRKRPKNQSLANKIRWEYKIEENDG